MGQTSTEWLSDAAELLVLGRKHERVSDELSRRHWLRCSANEIAIDQLVCNLITPINLLSYFMHFMCSKCSLNSMDLILQPVI